MSDLHYDPYSEEALRDPYAIYKRLRAEKPAYYIEKYDAWALSRFEDIWKASLDMKSYSVAAAGASTLAKPIWISASTSTMGQWGTMIY